MAVDRTPFINGQAYSWVDITVSIFGVPVAGITSVNYEENGDVVNNYGAGRRPTSQSNGKIESTASISIDRAEYNALVAAAPGKNLMNIPNFDIVVAYLPEGSPPVADIIKNCRFKKMVSGGSEGDSNVMADLELVPSNVEWNATL